MYLIRARSRKRDYAYVRYAQCTNSLHAGTVYPLETSVTYRSNIERLCCT